MAIFCGRLPSISAKAEMRIVVVAIVIVIVAMRVAIVEVARRRWWWRKWQTLRIIYGLIIRPRHHAPAL
jgi:hypothetical protein